MGNEPNFEIPNQAILEEVLLLRASIVALQNQVFMVERALAQHGITRDAEADGEREASRAWHSRTKDLQAKILDAILRDEGETEAPNVVPLLRIPR